MILLWLMKLETGWCFFNPQPGRWISRDPIEEKGGVALNCFVQNAPVNIVDVLGFGSLDFLYPGKCCNTTSATEYYLKDGQWYALAPGACTGPFTDCDGLTCAGKFYYVGGFETGGCENGCVRSPHNWNEYCQKPCWSDRSWSPTNQGGNAIPPGPCMPGSGNRGAPNCDPPSGYEWK